MATSSKKALEAAKVVEQKIKGGGESICYKCFHNKVCKAMDNQPCIECNQFVDAHGVTVQEWISVKDRLPKEDGNYLVFEKTTYGTTIRTLRFAKDGRKVDRYDFFRDWKNVWYRYDGEWGHITIDSVTHWMPLPQPPKGE